MLLLVLSLFLFFGSEFAATKHLTTMSETEELTAMLLARHQALKENKEMPRRQPKGFNPYKEFKEFTRKQINALHKQFATYDVNNDRYLELMEIKSMMEKLQAPQTHIGIQKIIAGVDEDNDGKMSFREFLLIFRKEAAGKLEEGSRPAELAELVKVDLILI